MNYSTIIAMSVKLYLHITLTMQSASIEGKGNMKRFIFWNMALHQETYKHS